MGNSYIMMMTMMMMITIIITMKNCENWIGKQENARRIAKTG
jgi:hypothetical protein